MRNPVLNSLTVHDDGRLVANMRMHRDGKIIVNAREASALVADEVAHFLKGCIREQEAAHAK